MPLIFAGQPASEALRALVLSQTLRGTEGPQEGARPEGAELLLRPQFTAADIPVLLCCLLTSWTVQAWSTSC